MTAPISLDQAKAQCRIFADDTTHDDALEPIIAAAVDLVERQTGHLLTRRAVTEAVSSFGSYIELNKRPFVSVGSIGYTDADGDAQTFADIRVVAGIYPTRVYPVDSWPSVTENEPITVTYTAGYLDEERPAALIQACLLLIGHLFANREAAVVGLSATTVPLAFDCLVMPYRQIQV